jgi:hypothetical protein
MVMSPRGSTAALWFAATSHLQIISGLPGAPSVRDVDGTFLGGAPLAALAVSDDGRWLAGAWPGGVYAFGPAGEVNRMPVDESVAALAFYQQRADLALATPTRVLSIADVGGQAALSVLFAISNFTMTPAGLAASSDNRRVVMADGSGAVLWIDLPTGAPAVVECGCTPEGVFAMGGSVFRLTSVGTGPVMLFDLGTGNVWVVPPSTGGAQ